MENNIIAVIVVAIMASVPLMVGVQILGNMGSGFDCNDLSGNTAHGWRKVCLDVQNQAANSFVLFVIVLMTAVTSGGVILLKYT